MKKSLFTGVCLLAILSAQSAFSAPSPKLKFTGTLLNQAGAAMPNSDFAGDFLLGQTSFEGELKAYFGQSSAFVDGEVYFDELKASVSSINKAYGGKIREAWFDYNQDWWSVRAGRQLTTWGAADGLTVTNVICPQDSTNLGAEKVSESRLGIDALRLSLNAGNLTADAYWIPFFTPSVLPLDSDSAMYKVLYGKLSSASGASGSGSSAINVSEPDKKLYNSEYALRLRGFFSAMDVSLYGFYGWDDEPVMKLAAGASGSMNVNCGYKKMGMAGFDFSVPAGELTIRVEGAFFPQRAFSVDMTKQAAALIALAGGAGAGAAGVSESVAAAADGFIYRNQFTALAGADWSHGDFSITGQIYADTVFGDISLLSRDRVNTIATLSTSYSLAGGNLKLGFSGMVGLNNLDTVFQPSVSYAFTDSFTGKILANMYNEGAWGKGTYGQYKDLSCVVVKGIFKF